MAPEVPNIYSQHTQPEAVRYVASGKRKGDITAQVPVDGLTGRSRQIELDYLEDREVWVLRGRAGCCRRTGRLPVTVRSVFVRERGRHH